MWKTNNNTRRNPKRGNHVNSAVTFNCDILNTLHVSANLLSMYCIYIYIYIMYRYIYIYICILICIYTYICIIIYMYLFRYMYLFIYMYLFFYTICNITQYVMCISVPYTYIHTQSFTCMLYTCIEASTPTYRLISLISSENKSLFRKSVTEDRDISRRCPIRRRNSAESPKWWVLPRSKLRNAEDAEPKVDGRLKNSAVSRYCGYPYPI